MHDDVLQILRRVNESFYQTFAAEFSATRERLQQGVLHGLKRISAVADILDLGCGNGELARYLFQHGHEGIYVGLDLSEGMLEQARERVADSKARFLAADLNGQRWERDVRALLKGAAEGFTHSLAFAVLHHIPGSRHRQRIVRAVGKLLVPQGFLTVSVWDFLASERLRARILPWDKVGLTQADVEEGDTLIDWRRGGSGMRYVHHFTPESLGGLAASGGFQVLETYRSDGENGRLGLYQVWQRI